ncbi:MAG: signal peptide peptidase SppA [Labilithrix sp.]|nr:signal peptide peptidase SppA [Labilithrix sp.]
MLLLRLLGLVFDVLLLPLRLLARRKGVPEGAFVTIKIDGAVADVVAKPRIWEVRAQRATSIHEIAEMIESASADPRVRGVIVTIKSFAGGMASATSVRRLLARARAAGKEVVVHLPLGGGTKEVIVATGATKVFVGPAAHLAALGFASRTRYVKRALDRAGVVPEVYACGEYKSAGESLVRDAMSDAQREQLGKLLDGFDAALVAAIAEGRGVGAERAREIVDEGPYHGEEAVLAGLADAAVYEDEIPERLGLRDDAKAATRSRLADANRRFVDGHAYVARRKRRLFRRLGRPPVIAVVPVHGPIAHAASPFGNFATDDRLTRMVRAARLDPKVKGVILHIDSPGGSALASDRMHHEIVQLAREKPVVACMANVAASGGYYVAAPAHRIVCEPVSITGSIGVVAARFTMEPLLTKLGITTETVKRGARAEMLSPTSPLSEDERAALRRELDATYRAFLRVVARGRKMTTDEVEPLARGRVYTGEEAKAVGLVDDLGGFDTALEQVRARIAADVRDRCEPVVMRPRRQPIPILEVPAEGEGARRAASALLAALLPAPERILVQLAATGERVLALWTGAAD